VSKALELIKESTPNTLVYAFRITAIRELLGEINSSTVKVSRYANVVIHELAKLGRVKQRTEV
jgi:hypothetical protein